MELDPLTLVLEIVNFLVLIWLLQRFLFKPVQAAIARRQQQLKQAQQDAEAQQQAAASLQQTLQAKIDEWDVERAHQRQALLTELREQRQQAMTKVREEAETEKKRLQSILEQDKAALAAKARQESQQGALLLTQQLLRRLAGEDLDNALLNMLQEDLQALSAAEHDEITNALHKQTTLLVTSARPLAPDQLQQLQHTLTDTLHQTVSLDTRLDESLISGIRLNIGPLTLHANLVDELEFFKAELHHAI